jgi:hypothetical protein
LSGSSARSGELELAHGRGEEFTCVLELSHARSRWNRTALPPRATELMSEAPELLGKSCKFEFSRSIFSRAKG